MSATGDSLRGFKLRWRQGSLGSVLGDTRGLALAPAQGQGIQSSNCFNALSLTASLKKKLWGNKESSLLDEADSFEGNKQPYQECEI